MEHATRSLQVRLTGFMYKVYGLMGLAFVMTAVTAYYIAKSPALYKPLMTRPGIFFIVILFQLALVICITSVDATSQLLDGNNSFFHLCHIDGNNRHRSYF